MEPPPSVPSAMATRPSATATALPPDDPPVFLERSKVMYASSSESAVRSSFPSTAREKLLIQCLYRIASLPFSIMQAADSSNPDERCEADRQTRCFRGDDIFSTQHPRL